MWETAYARLPATSHPHIAATAGLMAARMNHSAYPAALDMLLDSAATQLARPAQKPTPQSAQP
ncbi:hypothetical protein GCM10020367_62590 [Streptomyces sannanensis]|uniref:Uncharacterized protein n=1 Tax=Streptomyces sannanensis TaxID=285536 RepID=A0ABP6SLV7_9ACTN